MSDANGSRIHTLGDKHFCTIAQAQEYAHAAYLLARKEVAEEMRKMALAQQCGVDATGSVPRETSHEAKQDAG